MQAFAEEQIVTEDLCNMIIPRVFAYLQICATDNETGKAIVRQQQTQNLNVNVSANKNMDSQTNVNESRLAAICNDMMEEGKYHSKNFFKKRQKKKISIYVCKSNLGRLVLVRVERVSEN